MPNANIVRILDQLTTMSPNNWSAQVSDEQWSYNAGYETPNGCTPLDMIKGITNTPQFEIGQTVVRFDASFHLTPGTLKSRWTGPY